ncbi:hypothetical protein [Streptomyces sp. RerS4]|uniref:hypothetical protein n=1 Tax=Streptomyces sp. RerS4 TaxID=2942449 RepID=UPI00201C3420|nr:hypothetical protein [Streptomyces sp. RerS4]UQW99280.1 hypothetical protein M4D82_01080 [Streptomyces sp. RerS4]
MSAKSSAFRTASIVTAACAASLVLSVMPAHSVGVQSAATPATVSVEPDVARPQGRPVPLQDSGTAGALSAAASAEALGPISRSTVIERAKTWVDAQVPYSQSAYRDGYRTDCSGLVSMAWGLGTSAWTGNLDTYADRISKSELREGDMLLFHNASDPVSGSHVVLFESWTDSSMTSYIGIEQTPPHAVRRVIPYTYFKNSSSYVPYRYKNIVEDVANSGDLPVAGNWDGGPAANVGVWRDGKFHLRYDDGSVAYVDWGQAGDLPVSANWDGAGPDNLGVFRPSTGQFHLRMDDGSLKILDWGQAGDAPVAGNWDGGAAANIGIWRPSEAQVTLGPPKRPLNDQHCAHRALAHLAGGGSAHLPGAHYHPPSPPPLRSPRGGRADRRDGLPAGLLLAGDPGRDPQPALDPATTGPGTAAPAPGRRWESRNQASVPPPGNACGRAPVVETVSVGTQPLTWCGGRARGGRATRSSARFLCTEPPLMVRVPALPRPAPRAKPPPVLGAVLSVRPVLVTEASPKSFKPPPTACRPLATAALRVMVPWLTVSVPKLFTPAATACPVPVPVPVSVLVTVLPSIRVPVSVAVPSLWTPPPRTASPTLPVAVLPVTRAERSGRVPALKIPPPQIRSGADGQSAGFVVLPPVIVIWLRVRYPPAATAAMRKSGVPALLLHVTERGPSPAPVDHDHRSVARHVARPRERRA